MRCLWVEIILLTYFGVFCVGQTIAVAQHFLPVRCCSLKPWVLWQGLDRDSFLVILLEHFSYDIFAFIREIIQSFVRCKVDLFIRYVMNGLFFIIRDKWKAASQHGIDHDAQGPNICLAVIQVLLYYFWRTIGQSSTDVFRFLTWGENNRKTVVYQLGC